MIQSFSGRKERLNESNNVVESIAKSKMLYKELIKKSHPDKHPQKEKLAKEIAELVNNNRYNYRELLKLKERIENEL
ncbi:hypothetical protein FMN12_21725 [Bacteroides acidifaciens]|uniref:Uncharacterized protein n=2 Tax=Bacteroides acidifaciens TaxID=85831 RepID=A0A7K3MP72_9BACE|nr:hypothetical protein [Bacteroides acidifaciens]NDO56312.1 hypothetical protein [Bacteroides acidifaciens]TFU47239.1 hypothetical protein E4T97_15355 [Bacteroides acidifaciens]